MRNVTLTINHPNPLELLTQLAPLAPHGARIEVGRLTVTVDIPGGEMGTAVERVALNVRRLADRFGVVSRRALSQGLASRDRFMMDDAIALAMQEGWVVRHFDALGRHDGFAPPAT
jgi:tRNA U34 5-carboxymethylaminomethyl modifying enzyme MnmG/GidA